MTQKKLTIVDHLLLAARELSGEGGSFTAEDLVVKAWARSADYFGLQGYADKHPDSNRVFTKIMGTQSPLRKRGLLRKVGQKRYQLTDAGRLAAEDLAKGNLRRDRRLADMPRPLVAALRRMLSSTALAKFARREALTFSDVCGFWNISPRTSAYQFADRTHEAEAAVEVALAHAEDTGTRIALPGDITVEIEQLRQLSNLAKHIRKTFTSEIEVIESRRDERRS